jgi:hypothetical protein
MNSAMYYLIVIHFLNTITGIYKEMFRSNVGSLGIFIRFVDVILMMATFVTFIMAIRIETEFFKY